MKRATTFIIAAIALYSRQAAPLVTFESPCECQDNHGKHRWAEKNDPARIRLPKGRPLSSKACLLLVIHFYRTFWVLFENSAVLTERGDLRLGVCAEQTPVLN